MAERWFSEDELRDMSRPTMDRAIEAIDAGDLERARYWYKDPADIPERHWDRYGLERG
jgi:hypothetical protein